MNDIVYTKYIMYGMTCTKDEWYGVYQRWALWRLPKMCSNQRQLLSYEPKKRYKMCSEYELYVLYERWVFLVCTKDVWYGVYKGWVV